jgi:hypothetical protein
MHTSYSDAGEFVCLATRKLGSFRCVPVPHPLEAAPIRLLLTAVRFIAALTYLTTLPNDIGTGRSVCGLTPPPAQKRGRSAAGDTPR